MRFPSNNNDSCNAQANLFPLDGEDYLAEDDAWAHVEKSLHEVREGVFVSRKTT